MRRMRLQRPRPTLLQLLESRRVVRIFCIVGALADAICK